MVILGMPCVHAIAAIAWKHDKPENYCHGWLTLGSYNATYEHFIKPTQGEEFWEKTNYERPVPAPKRRQPGRPKKQRRKNASEGPSRSAKGSTNVRRSYPVLTCSRCGMEGNHRMVGCTNQGVMPMPVNWVPPQPPPLPNNVRQGEQVDAEQVDIDLSQSAPQTQEQLFDVQGPQAIGIGQGTFDPAPVGVRPPPVRGQNPIAYPTEQQMLRSFMPTPRFNPRGPSPNV